MLVESLEAYLTADSTMIAQLGTPATRLDSTNGVFPMQAIEQPAMPYLVMSQVGGSPDIGLAGTNALRTERWRFSCHGTTYKKAKKLANVLQKSLFSMRGNMAAGNAYVQVSKMVLEADTAEPLAKNTLYTTHIDFEIIYTDLE